ncbi:hypothetical protein [Catalinimonas niigatensis]|uniref:hypothetical protein n=1 Tax=Catalinimonas niigatensis TaxID=1397264 RepID=UPI0026663AF1|nr:hypothetical protein [Catalinimonas niigatensis]WPP49155.1 hypothetical protein PZB72_21030 [Catalinimonas niigatensis]
MKKEQDYIRDIAEIRSMMERSSKFLSLSGWAGILAGIYALSGAYIAYQFLGFNPDTIDYSPTLSSLSFIMILAIIILILAIGTAILLSSKKADKRGEKVWNTTSRRLLASMAVPLVAGGILILILLSSGLIGLIAPLTLLFYGLALYNASKFTYDEVRSLGIIQIILGLISTYFITYSLLFWAVGFGLFHIVYGIYMHIRYER